MNHVINEMLNKYRAEGLADKKNAIKEIMQEIVLCGLSRAGFFKKAAFLRRNGASHFLRTGSFFGRSGFLIDGAGRLF